MGGTSVYLRVFGSSTSSTVAVDERVHGVDPV